MRLLAWIAPALLLPAAAQDLLSEHLEARAGDVLAAEQLRTRIRASESPPKSRYRSSAHVARRLFSHLSPEACPRDVQSFVDAFGAPGWREPLLRRARDWTTEGLRRWIASLDPKYPSRRPSPDPHKGIRLVLSVMPEGMRDSRRSELADLFHRTGKEGTSGPDLSLFGVLGDAQIDCAVDLIRTPLSSDPKRREAEVGERIRMVRRSIRGPWSSTP
jgi:hypothetical protein